MSCTCSPAGILRPVVLLVLIGFLIGSAGCTRPGTISSPAGPGPATLVGNDTNASIPAQESTKALQGFLARPASVIDKPVSPTIPGIRTTGTFSYTGPTLAAKGGAEVNISEITLASETLDPGQ